MNEWIRSVFRGMHEKNEETWHFKQLKSPDTATANQSGFIFDPHWVIRSRTNERSDGVESVNKLKIVHKLITFHSATKCSSRVSSSSPWLGLVTGTW